MAVVTNRLTPLAYFVADIASALGSFNRLRWWRSRTGQYGLYEAATAPVAGSAVLTASKTSPHALNGKTLAFRVNGVTDVEVIFADPDPVTTVDAAAAIAAETGLVTPSDVDGALRLTTVLTGTLASIEILECDAAPYLGFVVGEATVGTDADTTLVSGQREYRFSDQNGDPDFWYRAELVHSATLLSNGLSVPFQAGALGVPKDNTVACFMRLTDMVGAPIPGRIITFANPFLPNVVTVGDDRWGVFRHYAQMTTDANGYAEIRLLRGMQVDFAVDGTNFIRRIAVPTTGDGVDLLDPALTVEDEFGIQEPNIDFAIRTS